LISVIELYTDFAYWPDAA